MGSVDGELRSVADNLDTLKHAHTGIADNIGFERMLSLVLKIGNYLNHGTAKGRAKGYRLGVLQQLKDFKPRTRGQPLLQFVIDVLRQEAHKTKNIDVLNFTNQFEPCVAACKLDLDALRSRITEIQQSANALTKLIDQVRDDDGYARALVDAYANKSYQIQGKISYVKDQLEATLANVEAQKVRFCEADTDTPDFLNIFAQFGTVFGRTL